MVTRTLTSKGARQTDAILEAAIRCLGRDGYSATSLQAVAGEAGVQKRMVVYYFGSRQELIAAVVDRIGERFFAELEAALREQHDPWQVFDTVLDLLLDRIARDRALQVAYFGLVAESVTDPGLGAGLAALRERAARLANEVLDRLEAAGHRLTMERDLLILAASAGAHGLGLELLERGRAPDLERAIAFARAGIPLLLFE